MRIHWLANCWNHGVGWIVGVRCDPTLSDRPKGINGWSWGETPSQVHGTRNSGVVPSEPLGSGGTGRRDAAARIDRND